MHNRFCALILLTVIYSVFLNINVHAYSQVYQSDRNSRNFSSPKIFKTLNADILMPTANPKQTNETLPFYVTPIAMDIESQPTTNQPSSSGRAIYTQPFLKSFQNRPSAVPVSIYNRPRPLHAPEIGNYQNKGENKDGFSDRFSPSEAVASSMLRKKNRNQYQPNDAGAASNNVQSYIKPADLYSFPPNTDAKYPLPPVTNTQGLLMSDNISSYLPPPSGPLDQYDPVYAASENKPSETNNYNDNKEIGVLPAEAMDQDVQHNKEMVSMEGVLPASVMDQSSPNNQPNFPLQHFPHPHEEEKEYATPPPGWKEHDNLDEPPESFDHQYSPYHSNHHHHHHDHPPNIIYDDFPHQYHYHDEFDITPPRVTPLPPLLPASSPEPPPEPRVKKYSYFYIGRKLWYIPLYFTVWFSFYVLWLILKSIARHKVNIPNHYTARRSIRSEFGTSETITQEFINNLTISILNGIEQFKTNYVV